MILDPQNMFYTWSGVFWAPSLTETDPLFHEIDIFQSTFVLFRGLPLQTGS